MLPDYEKLGSFYLGADASGPYMYNANDLLTHGVVIGMTGSGKTGLSVGLLEEAAIDGVPCLVIDPKGDLSNLLLTFPDLAPSDFAPWVPEGKDPAAMAKAWTDGLAASQQDGERVRRFRESCEVVVYTPGSTAGRPVSIVSSLNAPPAGSDPELVRERVASVAASLLALVGIEADPVKSREHVLLSNILARAWEAGEALDLGALVMRVQNPGFKKVGVLDLESFYPPSDRDELAGTMNNLLASPGFAAWLEGDALDIDAFLRSKSGKPRISVMSIAHLGDAERMTFVSLLLGELVGWMRRQSGTSSLRALFFMDEIFGYFPPVANPPSKKPLLTLLKQARAFGLGCVLATQNPVDLDYKGLSNCGTWFVGRLQTERDKARVLEGMSAALGDGVAPGALSDMLTALQPRSFLVHNVHSASGLAMLRTRQTLSYLRGPMTREELRRVMPKIEARSASFEAASSNITSKNPVNEGAGRAGVVPRGSRVAPAGPEGIPVHYAGEGELAPYAVAEATVRFTDTKTALDETRTVRFRAPVLDAPPPVRWEQATWHEGEILELPTEPGEGCTFADLPSAALQPKSYAAWSKSYAVWLAENQGLPRWVCASYKLVSTPAENEEAFRGRVAQALREQRDGAVADLHCKYAAKATALQNRLRTAEAAAEREKAEASQAKTDAFLSAGASFIGAMFGGRGATMSKVARAGAAAAKGAARASKQGGDVDRAEQSAEQIRAALSAMELEFQSAASAMQAELEAKATVEQSVVKAKKAGITVKLVGLLWATLVLAGCGGARGPAAVIRHDAHYRESAKSNVVSDAEVEERKNEAREMIANIVRVFQIAVERDLDQRGETASAMSQPKCPGPIPRTPSVLPPMQGIVVPAAAWSHPDWRKENISMEGAQRFSYGVNSRSKTECSVYAEANLRGNGGISRLESHLEVRKSGNTWELVVVDPERKPIETETRD